MKKTKLTKEGLEKLQKELDDLKTNKRQHAVQRLQTARAMGDLSENSEYSAAKEDLAFVEGRISEIEEILKNVEVIENTNGNHDVSIGNAVRVLHNGKEELLRIVGEFEANPMDGKVSENSPTGKALLGKQVGEEVEITVPAGKIKYKILSIA